jgi:hypothetical protein
MRRQAPWRVCGVIAIGIIAILVAIVLHAQARPSGLRLSKVAGWDLGDTRGAEICTVAAEAACLKGKQSSEAGGFRYPAGIAVESDPASGHYRDVYVTDLANERVQELSSTFAFIGMFGWDVNATKDGSAAATQSEKNRCTAVEIRSLRVKCGGGGETGAAAEHFDDPTSIAVDERSGDLYIQEAAIGDYRVDKYTPAGELVWMIGRDVNKTTAKNFCSEKEIRLSHVTCGGGVPVAQGSREHGAFRFFQLHGDLLAVGGPEDLLYCGDEHRVQEFTTSGRWVRELWLGSLSLTPEADVTALAIDKSGNIYLVYHVAETDASGKATSDVVREFDRRGRQIMAFVVNPRRAGYALKVEGMALDSSNRLVVVALEVKLGIHSFGRLGAIYSSTTGELITEFPFTSDNDGGIVFNGHDELDVAATDEQEILSYAP